MDDHPNLGVHEECQRDHGGHGVRRHCRCGAPWTCWLGPFTEAALAGDTITMIHTRKGPRWTAIPKRD